MRSYKIEIRHRDIVILEEGEHPWGSLEQLDPRDDDSWMVTMPSSKNETMQLHGFNITQGLGMLFSRLGGVMREDVYVLQDRHAKEGYPA